MLLAFPLLCPMNKNKVDNQKEERKKKKRVVKNKIRCTGRGGSDVLEGGGGQIGGVASSWVMRWWRGRLVLCKTWRTGKGREWSDYGVNVRMGWRVFRTENPRLFWSGLVQRTIIRMSFRSVSVLGIFFLFD